MGGPNLTVKERMGVGRLTPKARTAVVCRTLPWGSYQLEKPTVEKSCLLGKNAGWTPGIGGWWEGSGLGFCACVALLFYVSQVQSTLPDTQLLQSYTLCQFAV